MKSRIIVVVGLGLLIAIGSSARNKDGKSNSAPSAKKQPDGEQVYRSNCTRCHNTPPSLTQRETVVVVRHMRVRANVPADQAEAVLKYLSESARSK